MILIELWALDSANIASQLENSYSNITINSYSNRNETSVGQNRKDGIYPKDYIRCVKFYEDGKGKLKNTISVDKLVYKKTSIHSLFANTFAQ